MGFETETVVAEISRLIEDKSAHRAMSILKDIYGDGKASERILQALLESAR